MIVDRCNESVQQRKIWIDLARASWPSNDETFTKKLEIFSLNFDTPFEVCVERCASRDDHPTVPSGDATKIISCQAKEWEPPSLEEGFTALINLKHSDDKAFYRSVIEKLSKPSVV